MPTRLEREIRVVLGDVHRVGGVKACSSHIHTHALGKFIVMDKANSMIFGLVDFWYGKNILDVPGTIFVLLADCCLFVCRLWIINYWHKTKQPQIRIQQ